MTTTIFPRAPESLVRSHAASTTVGADDAQIAALARTYVDACTALSAQYLAGRPTSGKLVEARSLAQAALVHAVTEEGR